MVLTKDIIKMLYIRFANLWGDRFTARHTPDILEIWYEDWLDGLQGIDPSTFRDALKYCKENLEWSPSIAEFIRICDRSLNIPTPIECMEAAIRRDLSHPLTKAIFDKITSWDMKNSSQKELLRRFEDLHHEEMVNFRRKRSLSAHKLIKIEGESHGRDNIGNSDMRKAQGYLF